MIIINNNTYPKFTSLKKLNVFFHRLGLGSQKTKTKNESFLLKLFHMIRLILSDSCA